MKMCVHRAILSLALSIPSVGCVGVAYNFDVGDLDATTDADTTAERAGGGDSAADGLGLTDAGTALDANGADASRGIDANGSDVVPCVGGSTCALGPCQRGQYACVDGGRVCEETGQVDNGTPCTSPMDAADGSATSVCNNGFCTPCMAGADCSSVDSCEKSTYDCSSGQAVCADAGHQPDNSSCGPGLRCYGGVCSGCVVAASCTPADAGCEQGTVTSCANGVPVCASLTTPLPDGTPCGANLVCHGGSCTTCIAQVPCTPLANPCHTGLTSCGSGTLQCIDTGVAQANDAPCPGTNPCFGTYTCEDGMCAASSPVVCAKSDVCHEPGVCDPRTGACSNPIVANGTACSNGDACRILETCMQGVCVGGIPVVCFNGTCDADSGDCR